MRSMRRVAAGLAAALIVGAGLVDVLSLAHAAPPETKLTVEYQTLTAGPGEPIGVTGSLKIGDRPATPGVPVDITLDGDQILTTVASTEDGSLRGSFVIPEHLGPGERQLIAMVEGDDSRMPAVEGSPVRITGRRAATTVAAQLPAEPVDQGQELQIGGQVTRADNQPIGSVTVTVFGGATNQAIGSADTDEQGRFQAVLVVPTDAGAEGEFPTYPVAVRFTGSEELVQSEQLGGLALRNPPEAQVQPEPPGETDGGAVGEGAESEAPVDAGQPPTEAEPVALIPPWMIVIGGAGFLVLVGAAMIAHRRRPDENARLLP